MTKEESLQREYLKKHKAKKIQSMFLNTDVAITMESIPTNKKTKTKTKLYLEFLF